MFLQFKPTALALSLGAASLYPLSSLAQQNQPAELETLTVTSDLRQASTQDISASVEVLNQRELQDRGASHFGDALLQIPNLNFSSSSSRPRHLQIRGMGERDEYTGAPNPSVGLMLDGIDFSGIGMLGNLFDVQQVEVLRGPQSTRYGASALAGLVNIKTNEPTAYKESLIEASLGQDGLHETGLMTSGAFSNKDKSPQYRIAIFQHNSKGFRDNATLKQDDTNKKDELTARAKFRFWAGEDTQLDLTLLHANLNNGYDAYSPENTFTTFSDQPGKDTQETYAGAFKITYSGWATADLIATSSYAYSDMLYSYDLDWTADAQFFYANKKQRKNFSQEIRLVSKQPLFNASTDWLAGIYAARLEEDNHLDDTYTGELFSDYTQNKLAGFAQLDYHLTNTTTLTLGARVERVTHDFASENITYPAEDAFNPGENLWGGSIALNQQLNTSNNVFISLSRGYKAGGFNARLADADKPKTFDKETAHSLELGHKLKTASLELNTTAFYTERKDAQFDGNEEDNGAWYFFIENFDKAKNYGLETDINWQTTAELNLFANLGLLKTELKGEAINQDLVVVGRDQSHAPRVQYMLGAQYRANHHWYARVDIQGMSAFYYDNVHNYQSKAYALANTRLGYETTSWEAYIWVKNITDKKYGVRGLYFDPNPPWDNPRGFTELGNPRQLGATFRLYF